MDHKSSAIDGTKRNRQADQKIRSSTSQLMAFLASTRGQCPHFGFGLIGNGLGSRRKEHDVVCSLVPPRLFHQQAREGRNQDYRISRGGVSHMSVDLACEPILPEAIVFVETNRGRQGRLMGKGHMGTGKAVAGRSARITKYGKY